MCCGVFLLTKLSKICREWHRIRGPVGLNINPQHVRCCRIGLSSPRRSDQSAITSWSEYLVDGEGARTERNASDPIGTAPKLRRRRYRQFSGLDNDLEKSRAFALLSDISSFC